MDDIQLNGVYVPTDNIVARKIEDEIVIVPLTAGIGDMEDELFTLNQTGRAIWDRLDGRRSLKEIAAALHGEFEAPLRDIEGDVVGFVGELVKRNMLAPVPLAE